MNHSRHATQVTLTATFVEEITQKEVNVTEKVYVQKSPYKLEFVQIVQIKSKQDFQ